MRPIRTGLRISANGSDMLTEILNKLGETWLQKVAYEETMVLNIEADCKRTADCHTLATEIRDEFPCATVEVTETELSDHERQHVENYNWQIKLRE